ncbi:SEC-C metal-binding domain-containing protein [Coleofasciculus sp. G2-EDA-02]|uniref:SEC-C metal-binding domain-containing protein n=1 Tax=Coleofasciculus sp. G2-EDA-02 TaxID=3069529 RepID=UPI0032FE1549
MKTIQAVFAQVYLFPLDVGNTVVLATNSPPLNLPEILERIQVLQNDHQFAFPLSETAVQVKIGSRLIECIHQLDRAKVLVDAEPPVGYFDDLPSFNPLFAQCISDRPCPCGSGQLFQECHSRLNANCQPSTVETSESSS